MHDVDDDAGLTFPIAMNLFVQSIVWSISDDHTIPDTFKGNSVISKFASVQNRKL